MPDDLNHQPALLLHGGAGTIPASSRADIEAEVNRILEGAAAQLSSGAPAREVALSVVSSMEDFDLLNAGRGATYNAQGQVRLDACLMLSDRRAGAVAGVSTVKNPIRLAEAVLESPYVLLSDAGAERFADTTRLERVPNSYFHTPRVDARYEAWQRAQTQDPPDPDLKGTVGCVVRDSAGQLAAATSTGGVLGKPEGRIGDSPVVGAGTYASARGACSCSGDGEFFLRALVAYRAVEEVSPEQLGRLIADVQALGGQGGLILMPARGEPRFALNTPDMVLGRWSAGRTYVTCSPQEGRL